LSRLIRRSVMANQEALDLSSIFEKVIEVITNPSRFYRGMPKTGGYVEPLVFMVVLGVITGLLQAILSFLGFDIVGALAAGITAVIVVPIVVTFFGFVGAAIVHVIWKIMGSQETYETAYRCIAYATAIAPVSVILDLIPYLGSLIGIAWVVYLLIVASIEVHRVEAKTAIRIFASLGFVLAILNLTGEYMARRLPPRVKKVEKMTEKKEDMSPGEAGKAIGEFLRGMEEAMEEKGK
jgi:hypothetical protein